MQHRPFDPEDYDLEVDAREDRVTIWCTWCQPYRPLTRDRMPTTLAEFIDLATIHHITEPGHHPPATQGD